MPKGPSTTQCIVGIVADHLYKMAATIIGSNQPAPFSLVAGPHFRILHKLHITSVADRVG